MASLCKRQQCTIDRRGFRQELDSWRHKLIHCVGFESILEGLFGPELVEDLQLFKDREPVAVSDWSFDENCIFCCLRRDKVKEHLISLNNEGLEDPPKPLLVKDQTTLIKLERQAEEFLSAVFRRKDVPNFSDPQVPVVAREILQRMIRQFAAEYTSKTSPSQDSCSDSQPRSDQSLPPAQSLSGAPPSTSPAAPAAVSAHNQNPVLSKLLMVDQDAPLDLTIKKPPAEPSEQDGVLDLSIKKNRSSSLVPVSGSCLSPVTSTPKGEPTDVQIAQAKELQSVSTLEQFMSKLCLHHQRQIIDAIGFLQAEVKVLASSSPSQSSKFPSELQETSYSAVKSHGATHNKPSSEPRLPGKSYFKTDVQDRPHSNSSSCPKQLLETAVSLKTSVTSPPLLNISKTSPATNQSLVPPTSTTVQTENSRHVDHAPLKMKIMKTGNVAAGNKLSCVLTTSLSPHSGTLEDRQGNSSSSKAEAHSARLSSSFKRYSEPSPTNPVRQRETLGRADDRTAKPFLFHVSVSSNSSRTARKSLRAPSERRTSDFLNRVIVDPDLGHCDIVYIDKPITECFKKRHRGMVPRRNARKSTRGHMYAEETWELKTVRTLAGRGNCPNPMLEFITSVTPKQNLSRPEGVPPVDMPCAGECTEAMDQQISTQEPNESELPETGQAIETAASDVDVVVETSQTDQSQLVEESAPPLSVRPVEIIEMTSEQDMPAEEEKPIENEENFTQVSMEGEKDVSQNVIEESLEQVLTETLTEPVGVSNLEKAEEQVSSDKVKGVVDFNENGSPSPVKQVEAGLEENERDKIQDEPPQETQTETNTIMDSISVEMEQSNTTGQAEEDIVTEQETKEGGDTTMAVPFEEDKEEHDVSSKTRDTPLREKPPCRRKKGTLISVSKHIQKTEEVIVGFVYGKPVSASDRSLRRKASSNLSPIKMKEKRGQSATNKKAVNSTAESNNLDKPEVRKPVKSNCNPVPPPLTDLSSDTPASSKSQVSAQKLKASRKTVVDGQSTKSMRHLRSSSNKPAESPSRPLTSDSVTPTSSSEPSVTSHSSFTKSKDSSLSSPPPPSPSRSLVQSSPENTEQSQLSNAPETTVESIMEEEAEPTNIQPLRNDGDSPVQTKLSPRSANVEKEASKDEKVISEVSRSDQLNSLESPVKSEAESPIMALRSKQTLHKESKLIKCPVQKKSDVGAPLDSSISSDSSGPNNEKPTRMPLRSESSRTDLSPPAEEKRLSLRSQRQAAPVTRQNEVSSPVRITKVQVRPTQALSTSVTPHTSASLVFTPKSEPPKQASYKFLETLTSEEYQHIITNLNIKYDKMQKGWVQMDREGQPAPKYKNKSDRQAAIWKSKRRARKSKSSENQKYSPVQMLFMKGFDLNSICRWFLESTETKSLVIVKKVNTRLPSETQLCFHSSSGASGTSQGIFPSLQAERLKKHLKKFAIASPVKSNPKSQKLIAKALEQEVNVVKVKEKRELSNTGLRRAHASAKTFALVSESQKTSGKSQNPASARILRKYSNIREKMQVQHANVRLKNKTKVKANLKTFTKDISKSNLKASLKTPSLHVRKQIKSMAKIEKRKALAVKKSTKQPIKNKAVKTLSGKQVLKDELKKGLPKRTSQRLGSPSMSESNVVEMPRNKVDRKVESEKKDVEKPTCNKAKVTKVQKESSEVAEIKSTDSSEAQCVDSKVPNSPDQVLTRSQSKMEAMSPVSINPKSVSKKAAKSLRSPKAAAPAEEPALTRSGALKLSAKRSQTAMLPRSASRKAQELLETPAKRTRTK